MVTNFREAFHKLRLTDMKLNNSRVRVAHACMNFMNTGRPYGIIITGHHFSGLSEALERFFFFYLLNIFTLLIRSLYINKHTSYNNSLCGIVFIRTDLISYCCIYYSQFFKLFNIYFLFYFYFFYLASMTHIIKTNRPQYI